MSSWSPTVHLRQEHTHALGILDALNDTVNSVRTGGGTWEHTRPAVAAGLGRLNDVLLVHFRKEEEGLFPDLLTRAMEGSEEAGILAGFLAGESDEDVTAHTAIRLRLRELTSVLTRAEEQGAGEGGFEEIHDGLVFCRDLVRRHCDKEEMIIFPLIERLLGPKQMAEVRRRMASVAAAR